MASFPVYQNRMNRPAQAPYAQVQRSSASGSPFSVPGLGTVNTSITPGTIYSPQQTHVAANQAMASFDRGSDPHFLMKQYDRPGMSRDVGSFANIMPDLVGNEVGRRNAMVGIPFSDEQANIRQLLSGQVAREGEGIGLAQVLQRLNETNQYERNSALGPIFSLLAGLGG